MTTPTEPRSDEAIRADLATLLDELFPLDQDDEPNDADLSQGVRWWARTCIWWAKNCRSAWADRDALLARVSELEQERDDLSRVKGTDYEVVAYDGEAHVARHYEATSWDSPPEAELLGSVGDLTRRLDETEARAERAEADRDALRAQVAAIEALLPYTDEQFPIFPYQVRAALGVDLSDYILIPRGDLALAAVAPRVFHQATHGTGICPRCGESVMRPGQWVTGDPARVNCSPSEPQETTE